LDPLRTSIQASSIFGRSIWITQNQIIFENVTPSIGTVVHKILGSYKIWNELHLHKTRLQHNKKLLDLEDIPTGWFDGATQSFGEQSEAGGLIKITENSIYKWIFNCGSGTNTREELLGAWATLYLASRLHLDTLQILGDSRIII